MASADMPRHILITGVPGVGKTTIVQKVCQALTKEGIAIQGFYTEELRDRGKKRTGFDVVTLDGQRGALARVHDDSVSRGRVCKVGQYAVQLQSFESVALPAVKVPVNGQLPIFVIDEIGKMELFSDTFIRSVQKLFDLSKSTVICTIPVPKGRPLSFIENIRSRRDAVLFTVTRENRDTILKDILDSVNKCVSP